jgi:hypothetical protein
VILSATNVLGTNSPGTEDSFTVKSGNPAALAVAAEIANAVTSAAVMRLFVILVTDFCIEIPWSLQQVTAIGKSSRQYSVFLATNPADL